MNRDQAVQAIVKRFKPILSKKTSVIVGLFGEPGIGKTHTAQAVLREIACRCLSIAASASGETILRALPQAQKLPSWAETQCEKVQRLESIPAKTLLETLIAVLTNLAPFVLHFEDLHTMTNEQRTQHTHLLQALGRVRGVGVFTTSRTQLASTGIQLNLEVLLPEEIQILLEQEFGTSLPSEAKDWIEHRSNGNPLFALEFLRYLTRQGCLWSDGSGWHWRVPSNSFLPSSIQALIEERLARIGHDQALAAVFSSRVILPVEPFADFDDTWCALSGLAFAEWTTQRRVLQEQKLLIGNVFAHPLFQEVALQQILPLEKERLARAAIRILKSTQPDVAASFLDLAQLPNHEAAHLLGLAAAQAERLGKRTLQAQLQTQAVKLLPLDQQVEAAIRAGEALLKVGRDPSAVADLAVSLMPNDLDAVWILVRSTYGTGQTPKGFAALSAMSSKQQATNRWKAMYFETLVAAANYREAITYWQQNPDLHTVARASTLERVVIAFREMGQPEQGNVMLSQALGRSDLTQQERVGLLEQQANAAIMRGELKQAYKLLGELVIQAKHLEMLDSLTVFLYNRANIGRTLGHYVAAKESISQALQLITQVGHVVRGAWMQNILGMLQTDLGEYQAAETTLLEARDIHIRQNFPSAISSCAEALTRLYCIWDKPYSAFMARKYSNEAFFLDRKEQTPLSLTLGFLGCSEVELRFGSLVEALSLCNQAIDVVESKAVAPLEAAVSLLRGRIYKKIGDKKAALKDLQHALNIAQKMDAEVEINLILLHTFELQNDQPAFQNQLQYFQERQLHGHIQEFIGRETQVLAPPKHLLYFQVLGNVNLLEQQTQIKYRGRKRLECLAYLLETRVAGRSEAATADITQALYPELTDVEGKSALKQLVYQLRAQLGADVVQSTAHGYALGAVSSDLEGFLETNDSSLWRGAYLAGFGSGWLHGVQETVLYALKNQVEILAESNPKEAARLATIWFEIEPYDLEALEFMVRAHQNAGQTSSLTKLYRAAREQLLEVGTQIPISEDDFLRHREAQTISS